MHLLPILAILRLAVALPSGLSFQGDPALDDTKRVPVILGAMSKCPDAELVETLWDKVLDRVGGIVDMKIVYIGSPNSTAPYGVSCKHGESECKGNIQQLCAAKRWPGVDGDIKPWADWWNFIACQNWGPSSRIGEGAVARECAKLVGHDWDAEVRDCVVGEEGTRLLQESIALSSKLDITKSCTVIINGKQVCIHDGVWKDCPGGHDVGDFADQVRTEWRRINDA